LQPVLGRFGHTETKNAFKAASTKVETSKIPGRALDIETGAWQGMARQLFSPRRNRSTARSTRKAEPERSPMQEPQGFQGSEEETLENMFEKKLGKYEKIDIWPHLPTMALTQVASGSFEPITESDNSNVTMFTVIPTTFDKLSTSQDKASLEEECLAKYCPML
jgi:hypothetical protein